MRSATKTTMKLSLVKLSLFSVLFSILVLQAAVADDSGLLMGFKQRKQAAHNPEAFSPEAEQEYFSVWIYPSETGYRYARGPALLVPRNDGFWEVGVKRFQSGSWVEDVPYAGPVKLLKGPKPGEPAGTSGHTSIQITYVGPKGMSLFTHSHGYAEGAAHPWDNWNLSVVDLDKIDLPVRIQGVLGVGGLNALQSGYRDYKAAHPSRRDHLENQVRETAWGVVREAGRWSILGFVGHANEVYRGSHARFEIPRRAPRRLVTHDRLRISLEDIKKKIPGALDAFQSPEGSPIVVVTEQHLHIFEDLEKRASLTVDLSAPSQPVMAEWAIGKRNVERWTSSMLDFIGADI